MRAEILLIFAVGLACLGCGGPGGEASRAREESGLKPLGIFYARFVPQHQGKPPKDEAEFKAYLNEPQNLEELQKVFNVSNADAIFVVKDGEVAEHGTHAELMETAGVYAELFQTQSQPLNGEDTEKQKKAEPVER